MNKHSRVPRCARGFAVSQGISQGMSPGMSPGISERMAEDISGGGAVGGIA